MRIRGRRLATVCIKRIDQAAQWVFRQPVPLRLKVIYRIFLPLLPVIIACFIMPALVIALMSVICVLLLYRSMQPFQKNLYHYSRYEIQWFITVPIYTVFMGWAWLMVIAGRPEQIGRTVGTFLFLALVCIWPVYRRDKNFDNRQRKIAFEKVYTVCALIVVIQQVMIFWRLS